MCIMRSRTPLCALRPVCCVVLFAGVIAATTLLTAQEGRSPAQGNHDPQTALISTGDIDLFWRAFDKWTMASGRDPGKLSGTLETDYIERGSQGVQDFIPDRIVSCEALAETILKDPKYYEDVRPSTEKMQSFVPQIREGFVRLKEMYPDAVFPPVYFVIGRRTSGGTDSPNGLIIGAEMFSTDSRIHMDDVVPMVIHELIHYQQKRHAADLMTAVMNEGAADFIAELIAGHNIDEVAKAYGDSHEEELWNKFQRELKGSDLKPWLYNGGDKNRVGPPDLGYYIGYKICQSIYELSTNKADTVKAIIVMEDPKAIIRQSGYAQRFSNSHTPVTKN
jgi:hypothetical protein